MKTTFLFLLMIATLVARAADDKMPREVAEARKRYLAARESALKPVVDRYARDLEAMKARAIAARKLDLALAIDAELTALGRGTVQEGGLRTQMTDTTWVWWQGETITFLRNGKARWSENEDEEWTWRVADQGKRIIEGGNARGTTFQLVLDPNLMTGSLAEGGKKSRPTQRATAP